MADNRGDLSCFKVMLADILVHCSLVTIAPPAHIRAPPIITGIEILSWKIMIEKITALRGSINPRMLAFAALTFFNPLKYRETASIVGNTASIRRYKLFSLMISKGTATAGKRSRAAIKKLQNAWLQD